MSLHLRSSAVLTVLPCCRFKCVIRDTVNGAPALFCSLQSTKRSVGCASYARCTSFRHVHPRPSPNWISLQEVSQKTPQDQRVPESVEKSSVDSFLLSATINKATAKRRCLMPD